MDKDSIIGKWSSCINITIFLCEWCLRYDRLTVSDVIGVVKSANDVRVIVSKTTNKELRMREVQMVDSTNTEV